MSWLARFVRATLLALDLNKHTVVITSDHGNIGDVRTRSHTLNPVPTVAFGASGEYVQRRTRAITDITPSMLELEA